MITNYMMFLESLKGDMWDIIPQSVKDLHIIFKQNNKKLYVVGGAVRDFLNSEKPKDFDLCTDATPDEVLNILQKKYRVNLQGKSFGVVVVYTQDEPMGMEIATFREDQYNDKLGFTRNPDVKFSTIDKDVERRDIPFNALFFDLDKREIIDLVNGIGDLKNKITRFVGNPDLRIEEDPLRILRLLRFNCRYQFNISEETCKSIIKNKSKLNIITKERIWEEIKKAYKQSKDFSEYLQLFNQFNLWENIFPDVTINKDIKKANYLEVYLGNLFNDNEENKLFNKMVHKFRIEIDFARKIIFLLSLLKLNFENVMDIYRKKNVSLVKDDVILEWYKINNIEDKMFFKFLEYKPSISAEDLMSKGFSGPELGREIKKLESEKFKQMI